MKVRIRDGRIVTLVGIRYTVANYVDLSIFASRFPAMKVEALDEGGKPLTTRLADIQINLRVIMRLNT